MSRKRRKKHPDQFAQRESTQLGFADDKRELRLKLSTTRSSEEVFNGIWSSEVLTLAEKIRMTEALSSEIECMETESEVCEMNVDRGPVIDKDITQIILQGWDCTIGDANSEKADSK